MYCSFWNFLIPLAWEKSDPSCNIHSLKFPYKWQIFFHPITSVSSLSAKENWCVLPLCSGACPSGGGRVLPGYNLLQYQNLKVTDFVYMMIPNVLCGLLFSRNQLQKLANDEYFRILKNKIKNLGFLGWNLKKPRRLDLVIQIRWERAGTYSYICTYINAATRSIMLQL